MSKAKGKNLYPLPQVLKGISGDLGNSDLTRITRSTQDLFELIDLIRSKKASLKSLKDTRLDLSEDNPYSQFLITVMAGVNQLERGLIRMR
mgnify:CR=1 FL=1